MDFQVTAHDVILKISSDNSLAPKRRLNPSWSISTLKTKLELVSGVPPSFQRLTLRLPQDPTPITIESADEDNTQLASFPLQQYAELHVGYVLSLCFSGHGT